MATSYSHKFGQIIGDLLEIAIQPPLEDFARKNNLYLDKKGKRRARKGKKVSWVDANGNKHDLDFVIERDGSETRIGVPIAFIESAWRRYTRHSRNKAQEIQSAIIPLRQKYLSSSPFIGVVLAGVYTEGALNQLKSLGFGVLYFHYETVIEAFKKFGIDASFDEGTTEENFGEKISLWYDLQDKSVVGKELLELNKRQVSDFFNLLSKSICRYIDRVLIFPLYGKESNNNSISEAIAFLKLYEENQSETPLVKYEIIIKYNTGDRIDASFLTKSDALAFLEGFNI